MSLPDPKTPIMYGIIQLYDHIFFFYQLFFL
jgi:Ni,Fe-hydrogenase I large subunit